jgi:hypothetical protein
VPERLTSNKWTDWLKAHQPALVSRFIFITGDAGSVELNHRLETSELTVLRKPFDIETLLQVCRQKNETRGPVSRGRVRSEPAGKLTIY